uniref:Uncharacterized protein n=1 Tax=Anguilla anguilla TaxID=7936 RepID=A0A0E9XU23_ANGAN
MTIICTFCTSLWIKASAK